MCCNLGCALVKLLTIMWPHLATDHIIITVLHTASRIETGNSLHSVVLCLINFHGTVVMHQSCCSSPPVHVDCYSSSAIIAWWTSVFILCLHTYLYEISTRTNIPYKQYTYVCASVCVCGKSICVLSYWRWTSSHSPLISFGSSRTTSPNPWSKSARSKYE